MLSYKDYYIKKAVDSYHNKKYEDAIKYFDIILEIFPDCHEIYCGKGDVLVAIMDYNQAIKYYNKAIELDPNNSMYYFNKGLAHYLQEDYSSAIQCLDEVIRINPDDSEACNIKNYILSGVDFSINQIMGDTESYIKDEEI